MIPSMQIILKTAADHVCPLFPDEKPKIDIGDGELADLAFTVGYKFRYEGEDYGDYVAFAKEEPSLDSVKEAVSLLLDVAVESYEMLCHGAPEAPAPVPMTVPIEPLKIIKED